jgi:predicted metalloprotease
MRWQTGRRSENVEDRRRVGAPKMAAGGAVVVIVAAAVVWLLGGNPMEVLEQAQTTSVSTSVPTEFTAQENELADFVSVVLADTEDTWRPLFARMGGVYREPKLVLFTGSVQSACGMAGAQMGPFYCPGDSKVYIDLSFYQELKDRLGAPGDFAQAYVIAHEVGHHVQKLLGIEDQVHAAMDRASEQEANALSVRMELQADCFAGVWAHHAQRTRQILEPGDIEEALNAASAIGDDRLQKQSQGYVIPESFTHGTSRQRVHWFKTGFETGDVDQCNTFQAGSF